MCVCYREVSSRRGFLIRVRASYVLWSAACFFYCLSMIGGCSVQTQQRTLISPAEIKSLDHRSPFLKAHLRDGRVYVLHDWVIDSSGAAVAGNGILQDANRDTLYQTWFSIPIDSVALFETNVVKISSAVAALTVISIASLALTAYCITNPKACFGSCPTFYVPGPDGSVLEAEGFSASVAPVLEATDIDALYHARAAGRELRVEMKNEALETHVVRHADVLAARRPQNGRVFVTRTGDFREALRIYSPVKCTGPEGDCLELVRSVDGRQRVSPADSTYLGTREIIELEFDYMPAGDLGVVVASRQSLLSTYLFYQGLAYMGTSAGDWMARMEQVGNNAREYAGGIGRLLGTIEVQVLNGQNEWVTAGNIGETGPLATNVNLVTLSHLAAGNQHIRLRLTKGHWRVDYIALAELGDTIEPLRLCPEIVFRDSVNDATALQELLDSSKVLVTMPGDKYTLVYSLPEDFAEYELFLESRGYYMEWMRQEWLAEEDHARAAMMFLAPEQALRVLAPEFKHVEPEMEDLFWNSRYEK